MELKDFFSTHNEVALALSGGADSAYLLYAAKQYARSLKAYYVKSVFQPTFEMEDAIRLAKELDVKLSVLELDVLAIKEAATNSAERCYYCKKAIFEKILSAARSDGFYTVIDGTNASDDLSDRPGVKALRELGVLSPLREGGVTKDELRRLSKQAGLFTYEKPAYACLATRIRLGEEITIEKLERTERAEDYLHSLGFCDFRVRLREGAARIQLREAQLPLLLEKRTEIVGMLKQYYSEVTLDLEVRNEN